MKAQHARRVLLALGVVVGAFASHALAQAPIQPPAPAAASAVRLPRFSAPGLQLPDLDDEDLLARALNAQRPLRAGRVNDLASSRVAVGDGATETLGEISVRAFADQAIAAAELARLPAGALSSAPEVVDEAYELPHSYVISRAVRFTVDDPARVTAHKGRLAELVAVEYPQKRAVPYNQLSAAQKQGVNRFIQSQASLLPASNPLRRAAAQGRDALLRAVREGRGTYEILDTIEVPKVPPPVVGGVPQIHEFQNGIFDFSRTRAFRRPQINSRLDFNLSGDDFRVHPPEFIIPEPPPLLPTPEESVGGMKSFSSEFLAGFTRSKEWRWERRWNYPSGFFRATFGAGYRFGVRIPIEVRGTVSPTHIRRRAPSDARDEVTTRLMATTLDAGADFYRAAGLSPDKIYEGKELLVGAYVLYGWKFRALWTDIIHRPWTTIEIDADANFRPPFGRCNSDCGLDVWFPAEMTNTSWNVGIGTIAAPLGVHLTGEGSASFQYEPTLGEQPLSSSTLVFGRRENSHERRSQLAAFPSSRAEKYGFRLSQPKYAVDLVMIPQLRVEATLEADWLDIRKTFRTDPIRLNSARIPLGSVEFERHAGTRSQLNVQAGVKSFRELVEPDFSLETLRRNLDVGLRVAGGQRARQAQGRFLTSGGAAVGTAVHAAAAELDQNARFHLIHKGPGQFVIRRSDGRFWQVTPTGIRALASEERATRFSFSFLPGSGLHTIRDPRGGSQWLTLDGERLTVARALADAVRFRVWQAPVDE